MTSIDLTVPAVTSLSVLDRRSTAGWVQHSAVAVPQAVYSPDRLAAVARSGLVDTEPEEPFDRLVRLAALLLETPMAFVTVVDATRSFWKSCIGVEVRELADRQNPIEESFCQHVVGTGAPFVAGYAAHHPKPGGSPSITGLPVAAWAGFPITSPDGFVLGSLCVVDTKVREWSARDVEVLSTLAHAASAEVALRQALHDAHVASLAALLLAENNAELAMTLQESLLPPALPLVPGLALAARFLPSQGEVRVSGDFYDVFPLTRGRWGVVIGDVEGHGAPAAALTAKARHTLRSLATRHSSPRRVLTELSQFLYGEDGATRFLTALYATLGPVAGGWALTLASGGHPRPLLRRADGRVSEVSTEGQLLGCIPQPRIGQVRMLLEPGDLLVLFTDGVVEARREAGPLFGVEGVRRVLAGLSDNDPAKAVRALEDATLAHCDRRPPDDLAVLVIAAMDAPSEQWSLAPLTI